jgi:thymidylate kinase
MTPPFWVLLGPDFAGKSTALARLHDECGWQVVSHDDAFLGDHPLLAKLRRSWVDDGLVWTGKRYTPELVLSVLHAVILHQRDELARQTGTRPIVVDSYYYKVLAACTLLGVEHEPTFGYWRSFAQPTGVLYLDVPPAVTWDRAGQGSRVSAFEYYGYVPTRSGFVRLQTDLRASMLAEVAELAPTVIDGTASQDDVLAKIRSTVGESVC